MNFSYINNVFEKMKKKNMILSVVNKVVYIFGFHIMMQILFHVKTYKNPINFKVENVSI